MLTTTVASLRSSLEERETQLVGLEEELETLKAQASRKQKSLNRRLVESETLVQLERRKASKAKLAVIDAEDKNRRLRSQLAATQSEVEIAQDATAAANRNTIRLRAAVRDLESQANVANRGLQTALLSATTKPPGAHGGGGVGNTADIDSARIVARLTAQLDKHAQVHGDIERMREEGETSTWQNYDRRINSLEGQLQSLNATIALDKSFQTTHDGLPSTTSTPRK
jgi:chromosome segregation ATPase